MGLDFRIDGFHLLQLRKLTRLDHMEFLFAQFIQILLDSGSVISHRYSFQKRG